MGYKDPRLAAEKRKRSLYGIKTTPFSERRIGSFFFLYAPSSRRYVAKKLDDAEALLIAAYSFRPEDDGRITYVWPENPTSDIPDEILRKVIS